MSELFNSVLSGCSDDIFIKFNNIKNYFLNIDIDDINSTDILYSFVDYAEPIHKGLMNVFIERYLIPYLDRQCIPVSVLSVAYVRNDILYAANNCINDTFKITHLLNIKYQQKLTQIILSDNNIRSNDIVEILDLLTSLKEKGVLSDKTTIKLCNNNIHGIQGSEDIVISTLNTISKMKEIKFIDLRGNPFCSIDQATFFKNIGNPTNSTLQPQPTSDMKNKLIFLDSWNLKNNFWIKLINNDIVYSDIILAHEEYYKTCNF